MDQDSYISEIWKDLPFSPRHQVSNMGNVRRKSYVEEYMSRGVPRSRKIKAREMSKRKHDRGYLRASIGGKDYYIHRLVAELFIGIPIGKEVNHKNSDRTDNRLVNIEVVTRAENIQHSYAYGKGYEGQKKRIPKISGSNNYYAKFTEKQVEEIRKKHRDGISPKQLRKEYSIKKGRLDSILYYDSWKHVK